MDSRSDTLDAGTGRLDERARRLGAAVLATQVSRHEAACQVLAEAAESGVVAAMCARHHRGLSSAWDIDEITSAVTTMLVAYALGSPGRDGHLDVTRFADGSTSASGWVGKVIGSMRATRILREMRTEPTVPADSEALEQVPAAGVEDQVLAPQVADIEAHTKGLPATSATIGLIHASALHDLLGLPPLRAWALTSDRRARVLEALAADPGLASRVLSGPEAAAGGAVSTLVGSLWGGWARDDVAAMLAASAEGRDIPHLLCQAALRPLPRPTARSGQLDRIRARARDAVPADARPAVATALEAFLDAEVQLYTDFDRIRRPVSAQERSRRQASADALPALLEEAARSLGVDRLDVHSGLIDLLLEPLPVVDSRFFTPTAWRFSR